MNFIFNTNTQKLIQIWWREAYAFRTEVTGREILHLIKHQIQRRVKKEKYWNKDCSSNHLNYHSEDNIIEIVWTEVCMCDVVVRIIRYVEFPFLSKTPVKILMFLIFIKEHNKVYHTICNHKWNLKGVWQKSLTWEK